MEAYDPQLGDLLTVFPSFEVGESQLDELRRATAALAIPCEVPEQILRGEHVIPGPAGDPDVRVLSYRPVEPRSRSAILHVHGGGTILGSPEMSEAQNVALALKHGCPVVSVDYRLAPETAAPGNAEDCYAALAWLNGQAGPWGFDGKRIAVVGESAGGLLAASLALMARDRGKYAISFMALIYPMLDDRTTLDERQSATGRHIWTPAANRFAWNCLLAGQCGAADLPDYAVPARATSMEGLPPTYIAVGALDLFLEEDLAFAARLGRAGVPVELHVYPGAFHAFDMAVEADVSRRFRRDLTAALERALN